ncbi:MAG TPA: hypothetical protein VNJ04_11770 [Gemmatimonadaceae bacterium]|nr:hypothetical protein [Gemmatimonadaceae bacterium]
MPDQTSPGTFIPMDAVLRKLGLPPSMSTDLDVVAARDAAEAFVRRHHPGRTEWPADYVLGAVKLAAGLHRDAATPGIAEPFAQANVYKRATDVEIEQLLQIGRFSTPVVG